MVKHCTMFPITVKLNEIKSQSSSVSCNVNSVYKITCYGDHSSIGVLKCALSWAYIRLTSQVNSFWSEMRAKLHIIHSTNDTIDRIDTNRAHTGRTLATAAATFLLSLRFPPCAPSFPPISHCIGAY